MNSQQKPTDKTANLEQLLEQRHPHPHYRRWIYGAAGVLLVAALYWLLSGEQAPSIRYSTEAAHRDKLVVRVSATGNLQPTNQVDVGSELSGIVEAVMVDDNDQVKQGEVLARLDRSKLSDAVAISKANLAAAKARVQQAAATAAESRANLSRMREVARLSGGKVPSKSELDNAEATLKRADADVASAKAAVIQAQAGLQSDQTNLGKALIRSPINGVVLTRKIEPGQTVAASFTAPVLFTLAEDLSKMELQVDIDEADVGQVQVGQPATFSVDAWPDRRYPATITRVGYGSVQSTDGVVSYPATLTVDNSDLSLRPGMTATAEITTLVHDNALLVPNAALRYSPPKAQTQKRSGSMLSSLMPRPPRHKPKNVDTSDSAKEVWVLESGEAKPVSVDTGASDGRYTEITGGDLREGMQVITEAVSSAK